ncbi:MAG TPA: hypothetical protein PKV27_08675, partial [Ilumatobacteraceae bacterium]|nr:hypothetical protein [Ilumatobacteraceae bacterium]
ARDGVRGGRVQGGTYPAKIWGAFTGAALDGQDAPDWAAPPRDSRGPVRLYLPGEECLYVAVGGGAPAAPQATTTAAPSAGWAPPTTAPANPDTPASSTTPVTPAPPVYRVVKGGTTIPPNVLDPKAPLPTAPLNMTAAPCGRLASG